MRFRSILLAGLVSSLLAFVVHAQTPLGPVRDPNAISPALPPGHPDLPDMAPASQPSSHGSITIRAIQGTGGAPAVAGQPATVELFHRDRIIRKLDVKLDDKGTTVLSGLPLSLPFRPLVSIGYQNVIYRATGGVMDTDHPNQDVDLVVYQATEQPPAWRLHMRHVIVTPSPDGLKVTEMLALTNPTDRTWLGTPDGQGGRTTLSIVMPAGAEHLELGGDLPQQYTKFQDGKLMNTLPMPPGDAQLELNYFIHGKDGQAKLNVTAPGLVKRMVLFVPAEGASVKVTGLEDGGIHDAQDGKMQMYKGADLAAGHETVVTAILPAATVPAAAASSDAPKIIAGIGILVVLVVGAVFIVWKMPRPAKAKKK